MPPPTKPAEPIPGTRRPSQRPGPPGGARDRNRREKIEGLMGAARGCFLADGVEAVTIEAITQAAGVAKGSFYRYFDDKAALVAALVQPLIDASEGAFARCEERLRCAEGPEGYRAAYEALATELFAEVLQDIDLVQIYLREARAPASEARAPFATLQRVLSDGALALATVAVELKILRPLDPRVASLTVVGAAERLIYAHLCEAPLPDPLKALSDLVSVIVDGLLPPGASSPQA